MAGAVEGGWTPLYHVTGFQTLRSVLQYELASKRRKVPCSRTGKKHYTRGPSGRVRQLEYLLSLGRLNKEPHSSFRDNGIGVTVFISKARYLALAGIDEVTFSKRRVDQGVAFQFLK
jgi:hypothetical protein